ncbi:MAG: PD40 domain-containing protein, partial [Gammaproteobacteria bacterium]|nr:PD40 domain-containing protein [Gammaproteobacteria bacterium]
MTKNPLLAASVLLPAAAMAQELTPTQLASLARLSDPQTSPDGSAVVYVLRETDLEQNRGRSDLWLLDLGAPGAEPRRLTSHEENDTAPHWSADGEFVYFISGRSGSDQVWRISTRGGEATQVTDYPIDVASLLLAPHGNRIAFTARVFPDCEDFTCTRERLDREQDSPRSGLLYDRLFVRHWDAWNDGRRSALFTVELGEDGKARGAPAEVSGDLDGDVPSVPFGGREEIAFSADGDTLYFALREAGRNEPRSTNLDIFSAPADGSAPPENLTAANDAVDTHPVVSPDGAILAWASMSRAGYESDQLDVMVRDLSTGETRNVTADWDRSVGDLVFGPDAATLYV